MTRLKVLAICLITLSFSTNANTLLQDDVEYDYPKRIYSMISMGPDEEMHTTIIYARAGYEHRPNSENDFAEYDSTVDEAYFRKLYVNCRDSSVNISATGRYMDSNLKMALDHKVLGVYMNPGYHPYWMGNDPLVAIPCKFKYKKHKRNKK